MFTANIEQIPKVIYSLEKKNHTLPLLQPLLWQTRLTFFKEKSRKSLFVLVKAYLSSIDNVNSLHREKAMSDMREFQEQSPVVLKEIAKHLIRKLTSKDKVEVQESRRLLKVLSRYVDSDFIKKAVKDYSANNGMSKMDVASMLKSIEMKVIKSPAEQNSFLSRIFKRA